MFIILIIFFIRLSSCFLLFFQFQVTSFLKFSHGISASIDKAFKSDISTRVVDGPHWLALAVQLAAVKYVYGDTRMLVNICWDLCDSSYYLDAGHNLAKDDVLPVQMRCRFECDEKLTSISITALVRHGEESCMCMSTCKVFICKMSLDRRAIN